MFHAAVFAEIHVPPVIFLGHSRLFYSCLQHVVAFFSLASADDLTYARNEQVACRNCLVVIVQTHVECLDLLRIVSNEYRLFIYLLSDVSLVLCLQVDAPLYRVLEFLTRFLQQLYCLSVSDPREIRVHDVVQSLYQPFIYELAEEFHLFRSIFHHVVYDVLYHRLRCIHIIVEVGKRHFRLYHPELRSMSCSVRVFRSECRSESIYVPECQCESFSLKLSAYSQACLFSEEVLAVVDLAFCILRQIIQIERSHLEHLACALTVAGSDYRSVHIYEVLILEELVDGIRHHRSHPEDRRESIAPRSEMRDLSQELHAVTLLLQRIVRIRTRLYNYLSRLDLKRLLCIRSEHKSARYLQSCRDRRLCYLFKIVEELSLVNDLHRLEKSSVIQFYESEFVRASVRSHPAAHGYLAVRMKQALSVQAFYFNVFHIFSPIGQIVS